ncbi:hypothetical protein ACHAXR_013306 [Thalassiosira sp. AJA248-18]
MGMIYPTYISCRRHGIGRPSSSSVGPLPHILPASRYVTSLQSSGNSGFLDKSAKKKRFRTQSSYISDACYQQNEKGGAAATLKTLLIAVAILFGTPNFDGIDIPGDATIPLFDNKASALEPASKILPQQSSSSTWPPSPTLSDQLFKTMNVRTKGPASRAIIKQRYWDSMSGSTDEIMFANEKLVDNAVSTISTMYYDTSGGFNFDSREFYAKWKKFRYSTLHPREGVSNTKEKKSVDDFDSLDENGFATRENAVKTLKSVVSSLNDPYSKYLTREELRMELQGGSDGFLGLGALVESSDPSSSSPSLAFDAAQKFMRSSATTDFDRASNRPFNGGQQFAVPVSSSSGQSGSHSKASTKNGLTVAEAANLPVVTAIIPDSPAERAGLVVGDRIASVGDYHFTGMNRAQVEKAMKQKFHAENYFGRADLTVAKQVIVTLRLDNDNAHYDTDGNIVEEKYVFQDGWYQPRSSMQRFDKFPNEQVVGYKLSRIKSIPTTFTAKLDRSVAPTDASSYEISQQNKFPAVVGGDDIVHYVLLTPNDSIFQHAVTNPGGGQPVGYIRLTRFSRTSTEGYIKAINSLEDAGAQSYIIDLRNNYGGVIQEAMLTASTLLRDPHSVLCWTLNSRGGFKPQENMEYVVDSHYPGYLLSSESSTVSRDQVRREHPEYLEDGGWSAPTSYASLKELRMTRGIKPAHMVSSSSGGGINKNVREGLERPSAFLDTRKEIDLEKLADVMARNSQKKLVILINEGTASAAEVFASTLHDNGRTVALVGTKTFGKGLIQHTFPMPDGGGLRLTVAEYLTPSLQHVTKVGAAKYDSGVKPDIKCESNQGIPKNVGADLCVGVALDVLESEGG